jgi:diguanylate cyclase (GGDEF) domain
VLPVPCSIGIVMSQGNTLDYTQLIRKADLAMYQAKENGKNTFVLNVD